MSYFLLLGSLQYITNTDTYRYVDISKLPFYTCYYVSISIQIVFSRSFIFLYKLGFILCKAELPLYEAWSYKKKKYKKTKAYRNSV